MIRKLLMAVVMLTVLLLGYACDSKTDEVKEGDLGAENVTSVKDNTVCIWDGGSVRSEPRQNGKYLTSMTLGEKVTWTGKTAVDSANRNVAYYEVGLSDGKKGWASEYVVAVNAKGAVADREVPIYSRPDLLKITNNKFEEMEFLAVVKEEGDWLEVVGKEGKKKGWITKGLVSYDEINIAVGVLAYKAFAIKDSTKRIEEIEKIVFNPVYFSSKFIPLLKAQLEAPNAEEEEYLD